MNKDENKDCCGIFLAIQNGTIELQHFENWFRDKIDAAYIVGMIRGENEGFDRGYEEGYDCAYNKGIPMG